MKERIRKIAREIEPQLVAIRRELHQYPEVALKEEKTSQIIAVLKGKKQTGKCVMLRADIDALPVTEKVETNGVLENPKIFLSSVVGCRDVIYL